MKQRTLLSPISRRMLWLLVLTLGALSARPASAQTWPACTASPTSSTITLAGVTVPPTTPNGTLLGSPTTVSVVFDCTSMFQNYGLPNATIQAGNLAPFSTTATAPNGGIMYTTNVPGIDVELTATPTQASDAGDGPGGVPGWPIGTITNNCSYQRQGGKHGGYTYSCNPPATLTTTFTAQLVKVGTVTPGTVQISAPLMQFTNYTYGYTNSANYYASLYLGAVTVSTPACSVNTASQNLTVTLPTVFASTLTAVGSTANRTPFNVTLSCSASSTASITMSTSTPYQNSQGIVAPATGAGFASNVGVQLLDGSGNPVQFDTSMTAGNTSAGSTLSIPFYAQYYRTGTPVSAGKVSATVTFTMSYQ